MLPHLDWLPSGGPGSNLGLKFCCGFAMQEFMWGCVAQVGADVIAALGRHCTRLRTLWLESYAPAPALDGVPDLAELAALASLESLQLTFAAPRRYAAPPGLGPGLDAAGPHHGLASARVCWFASSLSCCVSTCFSGVPDIPTMLEGASGI